MAIRNGNARDGRLPPEILGACIGVFAGALCTERKLVLFRGPSQKMAAVNLMTGLECSSSYATRSASLHFRSGKGCLQLGDSCWAESYLLA